MRRLVSALVMASTAMTVTACGGSGETSGPTVTKAQAAQRVDELLREAFTQLPAGASLKVDYRSDGSACDDPADNGPAGQVFAESRSWIVPPGNGSWPADQAVPVLVAFWQRKGYKLHADRRSDSRYPTYVVETPDSYYVSIDGWDRTDHLDYTLSGSSPCVWENGTPDPE
ncbi:hypothetical protein L3i22_022480 [Actinoplanes sp. L3-i22]|nr:hypothetical protein L3i22_022480 [Actinoplanes sp. L3-i22]